MSRRTIKKDLTRTQILGAASELFAEQGYEQTSIDEITKKADIAKGTFYYHFDSKEEVVIAIKQDSLVDAVQTAINSLNNGGFPIQIIEEFFLERAAWTEKNPELTKVFFEQRIHQFLFRENDVLIFPSANATPDINLDLQQLDEEETNGTDAPVNGNKSKTNKRLFFRLIYQLVLAAQKKKEIRQDIDARELTQIMAATFLHAQGSWIGGYSGTSLVDKVHRWLHVILDGLYDPSYN